MASMSRPTPHSNCCVVIQLSEAGWKKAVQPEMSACPGRARGWGWQVREGGWVGGQWVGEGTGCLTVVLDQRLGEAEPGDVEAGGHRA